jgi:hypothetical protein
MVRFERAGVDSLGCAERRLDAQSGRRRLAATRSGAAVDNPAFESRRLNLPLWRRFVC